LQTKIWPDKKSLTKIRFETKKAKHLKQKKLETKKAWNKESFAFFVRLFLSGFFCQVRFQVFVRALPDFCQYLSYLHNLSFFCGKPNKIFKKNKRVFPKGSLKGPTRSWDKNAVMTKIRFLFHLDKPLTKTETKILFETLTLTKNGNHFLSVFQMFYIFCQVSIFVSTFCQVWRLLFLFSDVRLTNKI